MKNHSMPRPGATLIAGCLAAATGVVHAATFSSPFTTGMVDSMVAGATAGTYAADNNKIQLAAASGTTAALNLVKATAWANTFDDGTSQQDNFVKSRLTDQGSGLGITALNADGSNFESTSAPQHAIDNDGAREFVLFEFDQAVTLNSLSLSYPGTAYDADISVLAFTGTGDVEALLHGSANATASPANGLDSTATGNNLDNTTNWSAFNFDHPGSGAQSFSHFADNNIASKFWLVGAYNNYLGNALSDGDYTKKDYVKLAGLGGNYTTPCTGPGCGGGGDSVPEPSSLTLAALGLFGGIRRWKRKAA